MLVPPAGFGIAEEGIYRCSKVETLNLSFLETLNLRTILFIGGQEPSKFFKDFFNRSSIKWFVLRTEDLSSASTISTFDNHTHIRKHSKAPYENNENLPLASPSESTISQSNITSRKIRNKKIPIFGNSITTDHETNNNHYGQDLRITNKACIKTIPEANHLNVNAEPHFILNDSSELMLIKSSCLNKTFQMLLNSKLYNILLVDKTSLVIGILRKIQKWNISSLLNEYRLYSGKHSSYFAEIFLELIDVKIEQEYETLDNKDTTLNNIQVSPSGFDIEPTKPRKLPDCVIVAEEDLGNPPEVPQRLINMVLEAEKNEQLEILKRTTNSTFSKKLDRHYSDLGIFGHKYRLAFNKKDNGNYEYYKSYKARHQKTKGYQNQKYRTINNLNNNGLKVKEEERNDNDDDVVTLNIPKESLLPPWFKYQRDLWEQDNVPEVHHFYKEHVFV